MHESHDTMVLEVDHNDFVPTQREPPIGPEPPHRTLLYLQRLAGLLVYSHNKGARRGEAPGLRETNLAVAADAPAASASCRATSPIQDRHSAIRLLPRWSQ